MAIERLSETAQTLYAELLDQVLQADRERTLPGGSFVSKEIRGIRYWYLQRVEGDRKKQTYLGRETPELLERIRTERNGRSERLSDERGRRDLVAMLAAGGATRESAAVTQVLTILANAGVFRMGGVLVGTQAFACLANVLGVRFEGQSLRTTDVDIGTFAIGVASTPPARTMLEELRGADARFVAVPSLDSRDPSSSFRVRGRDLRVDFLTPAARRSSGKPVDLPHLGTAADPVPGLDYLLEDSIPAVIVGGAGVLVNVPSPARFALHKLWVARQRPVSHQTKSRKDARQAQQLLEVLRTDRPDDLIAAWNALATRPGMRRTIRAALGDDLRGQRSAGVLAG